MALDLIPVVIAVDPARLPVGPPGPPGGRPPTVVRTWTNWTSAVPMTGGVSDPYKFYTEYGMAMPQRNPGDVILVSAQGEVTNPYTFNVQCARYIGYGLPDSEQHETIPFSPNRAENVTPDMHHMTIDCVAVIDDALLQKVGLPLTLPAGWVLTLMMEAASTSAEPGDYLVNEGPGYGELVAVIWAATAGG